MQSSKGATLLAAAALAFASANAVASSVEIGSSDTQRLSPSASAGQAVPRVDAKSTGQGDVTPAPLPTALPAGLALIVGIAAYGKMKRRENQAI